MSIPKISILFVVIILAFGALASSCQKHPDPSEYTEEEKAAKDVSNSGTFSM